MKFFRNIFYLLTPYQRRLARSLWYLPVDLFGKKEALVPPKGMTYTGAGDFAAIGGKLVTKIIAECNLTADGHVLDVGSGLGRLARPLAGYLNNDGAYYGFDVVSTGVEWCNKNYKQFSNFHFTYVPISNDLYNLHASVKDWEFRFPYHDHFFDVAISISVFTHMQGKGVENYLHEISRVLKPGKCCFCTFFIMTGDRVNNSFFKYKFNDYFLHDNRVKDANVAYGLESIELMAARSGLRIEKFIPGWWDNGDKAGKFDFQDVLILKKI